MTHKFKIAPSILSADFSKLGEEVRTISKYADYIHLDIMDGHFVPNITIGPKVVKSIRNYSDLPFDVHLMIYNAEKYIEEFANAGADIITIHAESTTHLDRSLKLIKSLGKRAGISIVPSTHENIIDYVLDVVDLVLVMTVNPGFGGQEFMTNQLNKISNIKNKIISTKRDIELEVDGGINLETAPKALKSGADVLVSGDYIFRDGPENYHKKIVALRACS